jgi:hypothetical protein
VIGSVLRAAAPAATGADLVGSRKAWDSYFPFRLGDSWTYDRRSDGPLAASTAAVRTRTFDGTSFLNDSVGYKLVSDDAAYHLYTFVHGTIAIHSSSDAGHLLSYDQPVELAAPGMIVDRPVTVAHPDTGRTWHTTLNGLYNTVWNLSLLAVHTFGWPSIATFALALVPFAAGRASRSDRLFLAAWLCLTAACATPPAPIPPPEPERMSFDIDLETGTARFSYEPFADYAGAVVYVFNRDQGRGVIATAAADGSVAPTDPFPAADGDAIVVSVETDDQLSSTCVRVADGPSSSARECDL